MPLIIKKVEAKRRQTESDVERLGRYIRNCRSGDTGEKMVAGYDGAAGLGMDGAGTLDEQMLLMKSLMRENRRPARPVVHYVISWAEDDPKPTPKTVRTAVTTLLSAVGLRGCLALWSAHQNTAHFHVHVAACTLDPLTAKARRMPYDKLAAMKAKAELDKLLHLGCHARDLFTVTDDGAVEAHVDRLKTDEPSLSSGARDREHRTGEASAESIAKERLLPIIQEASSWAGLHAALAEQGSRIEPRGGGLVVWVGDIPVKASKIARTCSKKALETRLGKFVPSAVKQSVQEHPAAPVSGMDEEIGRLWHEYRRQRLLWTAERRRMAAARRKAKKAKTLAARSAARRAAEQLEAMAEAEGRRLKKGMQDLLRRAFYMDARRSFLPVAVPAKREAYPSFAAWLTAKGHADAADRWRRRLSTVAQRTAPQDDAELPTFLEAEKQEEPDDGFRPSM